MYMLTGDAVHHLDAVIECETAPFAARVEKIAAPGNEIAAAGVGGFEK